MRGRHEPRPGAAESSQDEERVAAFLEALADRQSRAIVICATERAKTVEEISLEERIPLSTCYRKLKALQRSGLIAVEVMPPTGSGKRSVRYRSAFAKVSFKLTKEGVSVEAAVNPLLTK